MNCPNCGKEMEPGIVIPGKICCLTWAPGSWQFPFPRKGAIELKPAVSPDTPFDFPEYPTHICQSCKTAVFSYQ